MMWSLFGLVLQLGLKLLPVLYQFKILKDEAALKEAQRRFEAAIRMCDENSLDSARVRKKHEENQKNLDEEWEKKWGTKKPGEPVPDQPPQPEPPKQEPQPTPPTPTPTQPPVGITMTVEPNKVRSRETFWVRLKNVPPNVKLELFADKRFKLIEPGAIRDVAMDLIDAGKRTIDLKINGQWTASCDIEIEEDR